MLEDIFETEDVSFYQILTKKSSSGNDYELRVENNSNDANDALYFVLGNGEYSKVLWVSAAHVDSEYRSMGLGGKMDKVARENFYPDYENPHFNELI